jgi:hypothetical protein
MVGLDIGSSRTLSSRASASSYRRLLFAAALLKQHEARRKYIPVRSTKVQVHPGQKY